jgi:hypothetical protein
VAPTNRDGWSSFHALVFGIVLLCLIAALMIIQMLADALEPKIGDIITFKHARAIAIVSQERILARRADNPSVTHCTLDTRVMRASGGSIVIEAFQLRPEPIYRVHWAGFHTSSGDADCGAVANLMLSRVQVADLISAAGGLAITSRKVHSDSLWSAAASPLL